MTGASVAVVFDASNVGTFQADGLNRLGLTGGCQQWNRGAEMHCTCAQGKQAQACEPASVPFYFMPDQSLIHMPLYKAQAW